MTRMNIVLKSFGIALGVVFIVIVIVYFFMTSSRSTSIDGVQRKSPNIIVIMADDMGWNDVSYHGSNQIPTPNIDALAYNGVIIDKHYTLHICTPSRTAYLTGYYPIRTGMQGHPLAVGEARGIPLNFTLLPEYLHDLGYRTHLAGKWHVGYFAKAYLPTSRGFDTFFGYYNAFIGYFTYTIEVSKPGFPAGYDLHRDVNGKCTTDYGPKGIYATDLFTDEAESIIANHDTGEPLYLHFSHLAPHTSGLGCEVRNTLQVNETFSYISDYQRRLYAGTVSALDESVGRIVEALNNKGMLNNSIIVFMSDNGSPTVGKHPNAGSNYPYRGLKSSLFEGALRTPALVWSSMIEESSRIYVDYFHITDWLPTLYRAAGGDVDDLGPIDGVDQWEEIGRGRRGNRGPRDSFLLNIDEDEGLGGAIKGKFKYLTGTDEPFGFYFGDNVDDGDPSAPPYNVTSILRSKAALAIKNVTRNNEIAVTEKILQLRRDNKVVCVRKMLPAKCTLGCLFDLELDPCETTDVAAENPVIVQQLRDFYAKYWKVLVPQERLSADSRSYPKKEGDPWVPWLTTDGEYLPQSCPMIFANWTAKTQDANFTFNDDLKY